MKIVMSQYKFDQIANAHAGFSTLRLYNQYALFPLDETAFEDPIMLEYFESRLGDPIESKVEKIISAAAMQAVFDNPNIPQANKKASAQVTSRDLRQAIQIAKLHYHAETRALPHKVYMRRLRAIPLVARAKKIRKFKATIKYAAKRFTVVAIAGAIGGPVVAGVTGVGMFVWKFLPEKVKDKIVSVATRIKERALTVIENCVEAISQTEVGKKVKEVVTSVVARVKPLVQGAVRVVKENYQKAKDYFKSVYARLFG